MATLGTDWAMKLFNTNDTVVAKSLSNRILVLKVFLTLLKILIAWGFILAILPTLQENITLYNWQEPIHSNCT